MHLTYHHSERHKSVVSDASALEAGAPETNVIVEIDKYPLPLDMSPEMSMAAVKTIENWLEGGDYSAIELAHELFRLYRSDDSIGFENLSPRAKL
jgi:hypothetical protein